MEINRALNDHSERKKERKSSERNPNQKFLAIPCGRSISQVFFFSSEALGLFQLGIFGV